MKTVNKDDYKNDGIFVNLDTEYIPYQKLIFDPTKYLDKSKRYYFYCKNGIKSKEVVSRLEFYGYDVVRVVK